MRTISYFTPGFMAVILTVAMTGAALADEGVVRITDSPMGVQSRNLPVSASYMATSNHYYGSDYCENCQQGHGNSCDCRKCCKGCYPADAGWGRPVRNPINRIPVTYQKRWPDSVAGINKSGRAPVYPMVYQPNDTTQLGFTYQVVPQWQPNPAMVPPMPWPNQWHQRESGYRGCNCINCQNRAAGYSVRYNVSQPTPVAPEEIKSTPAPAAAPPAPPTVELDKSAKKAPALLDQQSI